jgi:transcription elongation factor Elf1
MTKPRILMVEDNERVGKVWKAQIERIFNCKVCCPPTVDAMRDTIRRETFDSVLIDANLRNWNPPMKLFGRRIKDGIEFATFYRELQKKCVIVIYGPEHLPSLPDVERRIRTLSLLNVKTIDSPLPSEQKEIRKTLEVLRPTIQETAIFHKENPLFQPVDVYKGLAPREKRRKKRLLYRNAQQASGWANLSLQDAADSSWTVECGGEFQTRYFGEFLNGKKKPGFEVTERREYPGPVEIKEIANTKRTAPLIFWNTRNADILNKQFSDERLRRIPPELEDVFGISVAPGFDDAYNKEGRREVVQWCKKLTAFGQFEATKEIFKGLNGDREKSIRDFSRRCRNAHLNSIVDVYGARVDEIIERDNTAFVELTNWSGEENFAAPFDLATLKDNGVSSEDQRFEYTVYRDAVDDRAQWRIELSE